MADGSKVNPLAQGIGGGADRVRGQIEEASIVSLQSINKITTIKGDVYHLNLDLQNQDGTKNGDFENQSLAKHEIREGKDYGDQSINLTKTVYFQTDASRLRNIKKQVGDDLLNNSDGIVAAYLDSQKGKIDDLLSMKDSFAMELEAITSQNTRGSEWLNGAQNDHHLIDDNAFNSAIDVLRNKMKEILTDLQTDFENFLLEDLQDLGNLDPLISDGAMGDDDTYNAETDLNTATRIYEGIVFDPDSNFSDGDIETLILDLSEDDEGLRPKLLDAGTQIKNSKGDVVDIDHLVVDANGNLKDQEGNSVPVYDDNGEAIFEMKSETLVSGITDSITHQVAEYIINEVDQFVYEKPSVDHPLAAKYATAQYTVLTSFERELHEGEWKFKYKNVDGEQFLMSQAEAVKNLMLSDVTVPDIEKTDEFIDAMYRNDDGKLQVSDYVFDNDADGREALLGLLTDVRSNKISYILDDNRSIRDVIYGNESEDFNTAIENLDPLDRLFVGTNRAVRQVAAEMEGSFNAPKNSLAIPVLGDDGMPILKNGQEITNVLGLPVDMDDLLLDRSGDVVIPLTDNAGNLIRMFDSSGDPVFELEEIDDEAYLKDSSGQINYNVPALDMDGNLLAPSYTPQEANKFIDRATGALKPEYQTILQLGSDGYLTLHEDIVKKNEDGSYEITIGDKTYTPDRHIVKYYDENGDLQEKPGELKVPLRQTKLDANGKPEKDSRGNELFEYIPIFVNLDGQAVIPNEDGLMPGEIYEDYVPIVDFAREADGSVKTDKNYKRTLLTPQLSALEGLEASKQNARHYTKKRKDPKKDGSLSPEDLPPPMLAPTTMSFVIAALGKQLVEETTKFKYQEFNLQSLKLDQADRYLSNFNGDADGDGSVTDAELAASKRMARSVELRDAFRTILGEDLMDFLVPEDGGTRNPQSKPDELTNFQAKEQEYEAARAARDARKKELDNLEAALDSDEIQIRQGTSLTDLLDGLGDLSNTDAIIADIKNHGANAAILANGDLGDIKTSLIDDLNVLKSVDLGSSKTASEYIDIENSLITYRDNLYADLNNAAQERARAAEELERVADEDKAAAEDALKEAENTYNMLLEALPAGLSFTPDNKRAFNVDFGALTVSSFSDIIPADEQEAILGANYQTMTVAGFSDEVLKLQELGLTNEKHNDLITRISSLINDDGTGTLVELITAINTEITNQNDPAIGGSLFNLELEVDRAVVAYSQAAETWANAISNTISDDDDTNDNHTIEEKFKALIDPASADPSIVSEDLQNKVKLDTMMEVLDGFLAGVNTLQDKVTEALGNTAGMYEPELGEDGLPVRTKDENGDERVLRNIFGKEVVFSKEAAEADPENKVALKIENGKAVIPLQDINGHKLDLYDENGESIVELQRKKHHYTEMSARELILLIFIMSIFEYSAWEDNLAEADNSRYMVY